MRSAVQGCSCDATVIEGGKRNGLKENAIRISESDTPFSTSCLPIIAQLKAYLRLALLKTGDYHISEGWDGSDLRMHLAVARATMFSRCTGSQFGGDIGNGGC